MLKCKIGNVLLKTDLNRFKSEQLFLSYQIKILTDLECFLNNFPRNQSCLLKTP